MFQGKYTSFREYSKYLKGNALPSRPEDRLKRRMVRCYRCMMARKVAALGALLPLLALSQTRGPGGRVPQQPQVAIQAEVVKPEDRGTIQGVVLNALTGEPLRKATVRLNRVVEGGRGGPGFQSVLGAMTDAAGQYTIAGIEPGRYRLLVERTGFVGQQYGARAGQVQSGGTVLTLAKAQRMTDVSFRLVPQGVVTGRVFDEDGDPMQNVSVQCLRQVWVRGRKQWVPVNGQSTNDLGEYRIHSLPAGRYYLSATHRSVLNDIGAEDAPAETYMPTYYAGAVAADSATAVLVTPGAELRGIDIRLQKGQTVRIRGRILNGVTGGPVRNAAVRAIPRGGAVLDLRPRGSRPVDRNGGFLLSGLTPGSYWLLAETMQDRVQLHARMAIDVGTSPIEDLTLTLMPGIDLSGEARVEDGAKPSNLRVQLEPKQPGLGGGAPAANAAEDGTFTLRSVVPDAYFIRVTGVPETHYLKSLKLGDADVTDTGVDLSQAAAPGKLVVTLAAGAAQVSGSVQDSRSQPAGSALVVLIPEGARRDDPYYYRTASTDQNGQYTLRGIVPGEYRLYAFDLIEPGAYMDPDFIKTFERAGERVSVRQNGQDTVQLKLIETSPR